jgi:hypothetical protein
VHQRSHPKQSQELGHDENYQVCYIFSLCLLYFAYLRSECEVFSAMARKVIFRLVQNQLDQRLLALSPKQIETKNSTDEKSANIKKRNRFCLPSPEMKKSNDVFCESFLSFLGEFQIFIDTVLLECQFLLGILNLIWRLYSLLGLPTLIDFSLQLFFSRSEFDSIGMTTRFLVHLLTIEIDENIKVRVISPFFLVHVITSKMKLGLLFQLLKQLNNKANISQFRAQFIPQFAFYTHQKLSMLSLRIHYLFTH